MYLISMSLLGINFNEILIEKSKEICEEENMNHEDIFKELNSL